MADPVADVKSDAENDQLSQNDLSNVKEKNQPRKLTAIERTAQEGEALLKEMGYKHDSEDQGRRRTRSGARPLPVTPPPAKKEKKTPASTGTGRRGRPPKKSVDNTSTESKEPVNNENQSSKVEESKEAGDNTTEGKVANKEAENHTEENCNTTTTKDESSSL